MSQAANAQTIINVGRRMGAGPKTLLAALEAGLTESNLRNLPYGSADSVGVFQQRPSQGWTGLMNVTKAAQQFFEHAIPISHQYGSAGELAQAVQRSAFPDRYQQHRGEAVGLLNGLGASGAQPATTTQTTLSGTVTPGAVAGGSFNPGAAPDASLLAGGLQQQPQQAYQAPMPVTQGLKNLRLAVQSPQVAQMAPASAPADGGLSSLLASASQELPGASVGAPKVQITRSQQQQAAGAAPGTSGPRLQLPTSFKPTHQTAGLPGFPAVDVFGKPGTPVAAPISGRVIKLSGRDPSAGAYEGQGGPFGYSVYISDGKRTYFLTHFGSRDVHVGQRVSRGQVIGTVGNYPGATPDHIHVGLKS